MTDIDRLQEENAQEHNKIKSEVSGLKQSITALTGINVFMRWLIGLSVVIVIALLSIVANYSRLTYKANDAVGIEKVKDYKILTDITNTLKIINRRVETNEINIKKLENGRIIR